MIPDPVDRVEAATRRAGVAFGAWVTSDFPLPLAEGAGVSTVYPKPWWQLGNPALDGVTGRAYPDISMDSTNGTSQASPTFPWARCRWGCGNGSAWRRR